MTSPNAGASPLRCFTARAFLSAISVFRLAAWVPMIDAVMGDRERNRRRSMRLRDWDYRDDGAYFVTICTHNRESILDEPRVARVLRTEWSRAICGGRDPDLGDFVVMPNHVHGIVWITGSGDAAKHYRVQTGYSSGTNYGQAVSGQVRGASPLRVSGCVPGSLSAKVGAFKSAACKRVRALRGVPAEPVWQEGYHDRIIRDERGLERARHYILDNPAKWAEDEYNPANALRSRPIA